MDGKETKVRRGGKKKGALVEDLLTAATIARLAKAMI